MTTGAPYHPSFTKEEIADAKYTSAATGAVQVWTETRIGWEKWATSHWESGSRSSHASRPIVVP